MRNITRISEGNGIEADLQVAADNFGHRIHLINRKGQQIRTVEPRTSVETEHTTSNDITLVREKDESYSALIDGERTKITTEHGNGLFEALTHALNHAKRSSEHDASSVSQAIAKKVAEFPEEWDEHYESETKREELVPHAEEIKLGAFGTVHEIAVAEETYGIGIEVVNKDGKVIRNPNIKDASKKFTLVYIKDEKHHDGHYDLIVDKKRVGVTSKHGDCLHAAIAEGLNSVHAERKFDEHQVREDLSEEILQNAPRWYDEYRRKQSRENSWLWFRRGHLMKGAGLELRRELLEKPRRKTLTRVFLKLGSFYINKKVGCLCLLKVTINGEVETFDGRGVSGGKEHPKAVSNIHAEDRALKQIRTKLEKRIAELKKSSAEVTISQPSLEMLLSHSPCERCRGNISSFLQDSRFFPQKEPAFTLRVAELYGKKDGVERARLSLADWINQLGNAKLHHCDASQLLKNNIKEIKKMFKNDTSKINWKEAQKHISNISKIGKKDVKAVRKRANTQ